MTFSQKLRYTGEPFRKIKERISGDGNGGPCVTEHHIYIFEHRECVERGLPWLRSIYDMPDELFMSYTLNNSVLLSRVYRDSSAEEATIAANSDIELHITNALYLFFEW